MSAPSLDEPLERAHALKRPWERTSSGSPEKSVFAWGSMMLELIPKRTRRELRRTIKRVVRRHGPELIAAAATGVITSLLSAVAVKEEGKKEKKKRKKKKH